MLEQNLISDRYQNDGISSRPLNDLQRKYIQKFLRDERITYQTAKQCPLCAHEQFILIARKDRYGIPLDTVVCKKCGLVFSLNIMKEREAAVFYSEYYRRIYTGQDYPSEEMLNKKFEDGKYGSIPRFLRKNDTVVEIGTGCGWNLMKFKLADLVHWGFDFDADYINFGREKYGLNLHVGGIQRALELKVKADYLLVLQVLEHTANPLEFMRNLHGLIKDETVVNIQVPSLSFLFFGGGATGYDLLGTLQNAHNFLFDEFTLKFLIFKSGFDIKALLGGHVVIQRSGFSQKAFNKMDARLDRHFHGPEVVGYLKWMEKLIPIKDRLIPLKIRPHLHYVFYLLKPRESFKKFRIFRLGRISNFLP